MTINLLIAPDFAPECFAGWHLLNTLLQKRSGLHLRLMMPGTAAEQSQMIASGGIQAVYANPFDASALIRDHGYIAIARPIAKSNETVIATRAESTVNKVTDLISGCKIALTDNRDVKLIGLRLLEPADLTEADIEWMPVDTYQAAARLAIKGEVNASFFLAEAYHSLSKLTKSQLKVLVESKLADITHALLISPDEAEHADLLKEALLSLKGSADGQPVLDELGIPEGFTAMSEEDAEFMIDLMETLLD